MDYEKTYTELNNQYVVVRGSSGKKQTFVGDSEKRDDNVLVVSGLATNIYASPCRAEDFTESEFSSDCESDKEECSIAKQQSCSSLNDDDSKSSSVTNLCTEIESLQRQRDVYKERMQCLLSMNDQLQTELNEYEQLNMLMEQCITCPYEVSRGKVNFPGKKDLDDRIDCLLTSLEDIKKKVELADKDNNLVNLLDKILKIPLPNCSES